MQDEIEIIEVQTAEAVDYAVIWLHGLGADGNDFVPVVGELGLEDGAGVRFVFPSAPYMPVTCNGGYVMRAWYDIISLEPHSRRIDEAGIVASRAIVRALIEREKGRGIAVDRIFLAGFSQGGAVAYATALTHPERLAGVIALSTYLPCEALVERELSEANRALPIFVAHGSEDDVVAPALGEKARDFLIAHGWQPAWHVYRLPHSVDYDEIADIGAWLRARLGAA